MSLTTDVVAHAIAIANDNRFRYYYRGTGETNGSGAVTVPYTLDCCTYISYCIYLSMGWTWYNQPYSYYWPHVSDPGFDYFLTNTMGCSKQLFSSVSQLRAGDIIITDEYYGHTLMMISATQFADAIPCSNVGEAQSIAVRNYPYYNPAHFLYLYRFPDSGSDDFLYNDSRGDFSDVTHRGITFDWDTTNKPYECHVTGTATANAYCTNWNGNINNMPFIAGQTYRITFSGTNVQLRCYIYENGSSSYSQSFGTYTDYDFTLPATTTGIIFRLYVFSGRTANETVAPQVSLIPKPLPNIPDVNPTNIKTGMPVWMMLNPFL